MGGTTTQTTGADGNATFGDLIFDTPGAKQLQATVPPSQTGSLSDAFFVSNVLPVITSLVADTKSVHVGDPGFTLTINGSGFVPASYVTFNGSKLASGVTLNTAATITAIIPRSAHQWGGQRPGSCDQPG